MPGVQGENGVFPKTGNTDIARIFQFMFRHPGRILIFSIVPILQLSGQVRMDFNIQSATCTNNGSVMIMAAGGTAPYNYAITGNTCGLSNRSIQSNPIFNNLQPCTYTFWVMDASGQFTTLDATVGGNYIGPSASVMVDGCGFTILAKNGSPPLKYSFSTDGGRNYGPPSGQNTFTGLSNGTYYVRIEDTCNSTFITSATTALDTLEYNFTRVYRSQLTDSISPLPVTGGHGPFRFYIINGTDTLRSENNVFSMKDIIKTCSTQVVIESACGKYINPFTYSDAEIVCLNTSQGTAELKVNLGVPPFTSYYYPTSAPSLTFAGLMLSGLQVNSAYYSFTVQDQCGHNSFGSFESLYRNTDDISFKTSNSCAHFESVRLEIKQNNYYIKNKYSVECTSCIPVQRFTGIDKTVTVKNLNTGKKTFILSDSCGTRWTCNSEYYIPVIERCDSIRVLLINSFACDNKFSGPSYSGDTLPVEMYYLKDETGAILDSSSQGIFTGLINGTYTIQARSAGCDLIETTYQRNVVVRAPEFRTGLSKNNENCETKYFINIDYQDYPYSLTDSSGVQLNFTVSTNTPFGVNFNNITPGKYILKSLLTCWEQEILFPEINPRLTIENITVCPAGGSITIRGGKSFTQWQDFYESLGLNLNYRSQEADWYSLNTRQSRFNYDTATHTFYNIEPGTWYTVYLHSFASLNYSNQLNNCPVDSITILTPPYMPPALVADLITECDGARSALFTLKIKNGSSPFQIAEINCNNQANTGNNYTSIDSLVEIYSLDYAPGAHCFKVTDVCQNSAQSEAGFSEQLLQIQSQKNCDSTSTFYYSNIAGANYSWSVNDNHHPVDSSRIRIIDPRPGEEIKMQLRYKGCTVEKLLIIQNNTLAKMGVRIESNKALDLCAGDSVLLNAVITGGIEPVTYSWTNGAVTPQTWIKNSGLQTLTVRNGIGCQDSMQVNIRIGLPLQLSYTQNDVLCFGDSTGKIKISPRGGIEPYFMSWSDGTDRDSITKLIAGSYQFSLTDFAGCALSTEFNVTQNNPVILQGIIGTATCGVSLDGSIRVTADGGVTPYQYQWNFGETTNQLTRLNPGVYQITATDRFFCQGVARFVVNPGPQIFSQRIDTICAGFHLRVGNSIYTVSGNYQDTLKTYKGCDSIVLTALTVNPPLQFSLSAVSPGCFGQNNGIITISGLNSKSPYSLSLNGQNVSGLTTDQLAAGNYIAKVTDGYGCFTEKGTALSNPKRIELEAGRDSLIKIGDSVLFQAISNLNPNEIKNIRWNSDQGLICDHCTTALLKPRKDQTIVVTLENNSGCKITDQFTLKVDNDFKVFAPNVLYVNSLTGNDQNSRFTLFSDQQVAEIEYLRIFNRFGAVVFETKNIQPGDLTAGWDGLVNNQPAESGVYVFVARIRFADESVQTKSGDITVIR